MPQVRGEATQGARPTRAFWLALFALVAAGLTVRLFDLTDPPLGFHPTRQMRGALMARYLYFRLHPPREAWRQHVVNEAVAHFGAYEPPILESLVALTYLLLGREAPWVGRLYSTLFWTGTALLVVLWVAQSTRVPWAGWGAGAYVLALPFAVKAGRAFQPDPFMTLLITATGYLAWHAAHRTSAARLTHWDGFTALSAGLAVLVKPFAIYMVGPMLLVYGYARWGRRFWTSPHFWAVMLLTAGPVLGFLLFFRRGNALDYFRHWTWELRHLWLDPKFYPRWMRFAGKFLGAGWMALGLLAAFAAPSSVMPFLLAWLVGYVLYGLSVPYQITSHNYYHLPFIPWVALGSGFAWSRLWPFWAQRGKAVRIPVFVVAAVWVLYGLAEGYTDVVDTWHDEAAFYRRAGQAIPLGEPAIGLVQDYGYPLAYYGERWVEPWPSSAEQTLARLRGRSPANLLEEFRARTQGYTLFVVTDFREWEHQEALRRLLTENCPLRVQTQDVLVFDLTGCRLNP